MNTLSSERLEFRPFHLDCVKEVLEKFTRANAEEFICPFTPKNEEEERTFLLGVIATNESGKTDNRFVYRKSDNAFLGTIGLMDLDRDIPEIGLWIAPEYQGNGYGSETYARMLDHARDEYRVIHLAHHTLRKNSASVALAEKFGGTIVTSDTRMALGVEEPSDSYYVPVPL